MDKKEDQKKEEYGVSQIQILEGIEAIRKRPGMYIGPTDKPDHLLAEVLDNVVDEVMNVGKQEKTEAEVILSSDQKTITVKDKLRGIPIGKHPETKKSTLETIFTILHSGGKFDDKVYKTSGGLHGVGLTAVNALSENLKVWSKREGKTEFLEFQRGILVNSEIMETPGEDDGVTITFTPDNKIFREINYFKIEDIQNRLKELAYLNPNLSWIFSFPPEFNPVTYHFTSGLAGWIEETIEDYLENTKICAEEWTNPEAKEYFHLNFAFQYSQNRKYEIKSFCNNITTGGGSHVESFESGLVNACRDWIKEKNLNLKVNILKEDVLEGLTVVLAIRMKDPEFSGQTKDRLNNKEIREVVRKKTYDLVTKFLQDNASSAEAIVKKISNNAQNRAKSEEFQKSLRESGRGSASPETPCISKDTANNELFIVEGESAGGSAKLARNPNDQAVLPVQGKIINVEKAENRQIFENKEIKNLINALGFSVSEATQNYYNRFRGKLDNEAALEGLEIPEEFIYQEEEKEQIIPAHTALSLEQLKTIVTKTKQHLLKKLRYGKVIIMTDADPDGKHIECLALTFFARYFRYLIEEHRLYLAVPPLYRWQSKKETKYLYNDHELKEYRQQNKGMQGVRLQRFKGLGEMNPQQLRETTMASKKRCLHELIYPNALTIQQIIQELMGPKSDKRKERLESGEHKNAQLVVNEDKLDIGQALLVKFLEYAYSVVEDRALPQLYDGLKPVQRRILYTLYELGLFPNKPHRKSAKITGDVTGNYHPHGTQSVYQAMVKMAQDFNYRYPLLDGQGNWGSMDGDSAAAERYTEARLTKFGAYLLEDLAFETVEWLDNYDETKQEPKILPANLNLLLNGSSGIAVGMSTNIPPHNLGEVVDATINLIRNPEISLEQLLSYLPGPDFPTGGQILEQGGIKTIYEKGEGTIYVRAKAEINSSKSEKDSKSAKRDLIHITELPYKANKAKLIENIQRIIKDKKIDGLKSVADYSSWEEMVNIHLKFDPNYDGEVILNQLYKSTRLQNTFSVKMRALIDDQPKIFSLKEIIQGFVEQRLANIQKKAQFIYQKNQKELINLETRRFIIDHYQEIAEIVRTAKSDEERSQRLNSRFQLEQEAINRILDTPASFRQFTPERRDKLQKEIDNLKENNSQQQLLIDQQEQRKEKLIQELETLKNDYAHDRRRTAITSISHSIEERQLIPHEDRIILLSRSEEKKEGKTNNYLKVHQVEDLESTNIPSRGKELKTRGDNWGIMKLSRRDDLWCFSNYGKLYIVNFYQFAAINKTTNLNEEYFVRKGKTTLQSNESFTFALSVPEEIKEKFLFVITKKGKIKLWTVVSLQKISKSGKRIINLYQKVTEKCSEHQSKLEEHKIANCCDKSQGVKAYANCANFRDLQKQIKECLNCQTVWKGGDDQIIKTVLIEGNKEEIEVVIKRKAKEGQVKNLKISAYRQKRIAYCSIHQEEREQHKATPHECNISCAQSRQLHQRIKECPNCRNPQFFTKQLRKQIKCEKVVDLLINQPEVQKEDCLLLLIKKDNVCEKKSWTNTKTWICNDNKLKKTNYCTKHWKEWEKLEKETETKNKFLREEKDKIEEKVLKSYLPNETKKEILKIVKVIEGTNFTREIERKIANSSVDNSIGEVAIQEQTKNLKQEGERHKQLTQDYKESQIKLNDFKKKIKQSCQDCQKYCDNHEKQTQEQAVQHEGANCCDKKSKEINQIKAKIETNQIKLEQLRKNKPESSKEIQQLISDLAKQRERSTKLRYEAFANRAKCPVLNKLKEERSICPNCQKQNKKKHQYLWENPLLHARLINQKSENPEIYLLAEEDVCWYNKKDLVSFLESGSRARSLLKDRQKEITDIRFY